MTIFLPNTGWKCGGKIDCEMLSGENVPISLGDFDPPPPLCTAPTQHKTLSSPHTRKDYPFAKTVSYSCLITLSQNYMYELRHLPIPTYNTQSVSFSSTPGIQREEVQAGSHLLHLRFHPLPYQQTAPSCTWQIDR